MERWLAVADLHFGYELSQRSAGRLMPLWGMTSIEDRFLDEYQPHQRIIAAAAELLAQLRERCEVIALVGNHDRYVARTIEFIPRWEIPDFVFQHGHWRV